MNHQIGGRQMQYGEKKNMDNREFREDSSPAIVISRKI